MSDVFVWRVIELQRARVWVELEALNLSHVIRSAAGFAVVRLNPDEVRLMSPSSNVQLRALVRPPIYAHRLLPGARSTNTSTRSNTRSSSSRPANSISNGSCERELSLRRRPFKTTRGGRPEESLTPTGILMRPLQPPSRSVLPLVFGAALHTSLSVTSPQRNAPPPSPTLALLINELTFSSAR